MLRAVSALGGDKPSVTQNRVSSTLQRKPAWNVGWLSPSRCPQAPGLILPRGAGRWSMGQGVNLHLAVCSHSPARPGGLCKGHSPSWGLSPCALGRVVAQAQLCSGHWNGLDQPRRRFSSGRYRVGAAPSPGAARLSRLKVSVHSVLHLADQKKCLQAYESSPDCTETSPFRDQSHTACMEPLVQAEPAEEVTGLKLHARQAEI